MAKLIEGSLTGAKAVERISAMPKSIKSSIIDKEQGVYTISDEIVEKTVPSWKGGTAQSVQIACTIGEGNAKKTETFPLSCFKVGEPIYRNSNLDLLDNCANSGKYDYLDIYNEIKGKKFRLHHSRGYRRSLSKGVLYTGEFSYWTKEE